MTTAYDSNSSGFATGPVGNPARGLDLANPQFRFPVKATGAESTPPSGVCPAQPNALTVEIAGAPASVALHAAHAAVHPPHFQIVPAEQFVGWSVQEVAWTDSAEHPAGERPAPPSPLTTPVAFPVAEKLRATGRSATDPIEPEFPKEPAQARPLELPRSMEAEAAVRHWPTSSRQQVSGFAIQRTRIDQPQTIVTGAGLAAGHRRWAARNLSTELQTRLVANSRGAESDGARQQVDRMPGEATEQLKPQRMDSVSGGLPLVVHPDFRWNPVVEQLCREQNLASQLLAAADQLLQAGRGRMLVAGSQRQQGTTTLAATISRLLIERGQRVLMVDADLARAGWTSELELTAAGSWVEQVEAFEPLQAAMAISRRSNAAAVALRPVGSRKLLPPFLLDYLGQLLQPFAGQFDTTVIDLGPITQLLEELSQPERLGAALLIVQQGGPDAAVELRRAKTTLNAFGISRLAVAQNFATSKAA